MKDADLVVECFDRAMAALIARMSPKELLRAYTFQRRFPADTPGRRLVWSALARRLAQFSPEQMLAELTPGDVLAGLAPEQRLAVIPPEQRLAGLTEAEAVLALPDAVLRGLSNEYLATLPEEARAAIRKRLGGTTAPRRPTGRRPKSRGRSG